MRRRFLPSTQALACFEAAARHQSYTLAAQELALTQSAVSRQIAGLEDLLGLPLFKRTRHGVSLTEAGQQYARQAAHWLQGLEHDTLEVMAHHGKSGSISLAAVPTFATRWLVPRLPLLAQQHPDLLVHIDVRTRPFSFADSHFDAALCAGTPEQLANWPGVQAQWLMDEYIVPVCSPALLDTVVQRGQGRAHQPVRPTEIARLPLLQQSTRPYAWRQWLETAGIPSLHALEGPRYELFSMLAEAATCAMGVALMPPLLIQAELLRGDLVIANALPLQLEHSYYLVTPEGKRSEALERFSTWLLGLVDAAK
ncbi:MAG: LysR family transcriptional regulator [Comamonas sp.]|nr:LysR family transcriptional regulator [Comamonas sp.]